MRLQEDAGLQVVTNGEFRRSSYWGRFVERCSGFEIKPAVFKFRDDHGHEVDFTATYAAAKLAPHAPLATTSSRSCAASPRSRRRSPCRRRPPCTSTAAPILPTRRIYADVETFFADLAKIYQQEIADLAKAGCRYIQLDEVAVAMLCDPAIRERISGAGQNPDRLVDLYIKAINDCVAGAPADMVIGVHMCRGNFRGRYLSEGGYESVAALRRQDQSHPLPAGVRHRPRGDFKPLRFVPPDKGVVLGLVSTKTPVLETVEDLQRRTGEGREVHRSRSPGRRPAVRVRLHRRRQPARPRRENAPSSVCWSMPPARSGVEGGISGCRRVPTPGLSSGRDCAKSLPRLQGDVAEWLKAAVC